MKRLLVFVAGGMALAMLSGCFSQQVIAREFYEPNDQTITKREDGYYVGAIKSETTRTGSRDEGAKEFNIGLINR